MDYIPFTQEHRKNKCSCRDDQYQHLSGAEHHDLRSTFLGKTCMVFTHWMGELPIWLLISIFLCLEFCSFGC